MGYRNFLLVSFRNRTLRPVITALTGELEMREQSVAPRTSLNQWMADFKEALVANAHFRFQLFNERQVADVDVRHGRSDDKLRNYAAHCECGDPRPDPDHEPFPETALLHHDHERGDARDEKRNRNERDGNLHRGQGHMIEPGGAEVAADDAHNKRRRCTCGKLHPVRYDRHERALKHTEEPG